MINSRSCHPLEHKLSGINYLINRLTLYPITNYNARKEEEIVDYLLEINGFQILCSKQLIQKNHLQKSKTLEFNNPGKWAVFTYIGRDTRSVTKLFKVVNVNISYRTRNTIGNILTAKKLDNNPYNESWIYKLKCQSCPKAYIGPTGRNFKTGFKEHVLDIKNNRSKTGFSNHILDTGHIYGNVENTMEILNFHEKCNYLNTLEKISYL
jgi:hypothetical protein